MKWFLLLLVLITAATKGQEKDSITYIKFNAVVINDDYERIVWQDSTSNVYEFDLKGQSTIKCSLTSLADGTILLSQYLNEKWMAVDDAFYYVAFPSGNEDYLTPAFMITDFDKYGNEDLIIWSHTNVNGNMWTSIYLNNPSKNRLEILKTTPDEQDVWCAPNYDSKTKMITSMQVSGNYGYSYTSKYKLENQIAVPLTKEESDNTQLNAETGKGGILKYYTGKKGKWKLKQKIKVQPGPTEKE